ncbi:hypothetical protein V492_03679 [Pseudogymnoascus sp. VKM F-4246]|nr:hypothetical protein V492_03679 [Pseudogymnoascus sp. VKM F-4246]
MHFTKTLVVLLLPLLAITSPTPSDSVDDVATTADIESRASANLAELRALKQRYNSAHNEFQSIANSLVGPSNSVAGQWTGTAGKSFKTALAKYRADQKRANADLANLAKGLGKYIDAINHHDSTNKKFF